MKAAPSHAFIAIAGNKCDMPDAQRSISKDAARTLVSDANAEWLAYHGKQGTPMPPPILYLEVSARTGERIDSLFMCIMKTLIAQQAEHPYAYETSSTISPFSSSSKTTSNCKC